MFCYTSVFIILYFLLLYFLLIVFMCFLRIVKMNMFNSMYTHARRITKKNKIIKDNSSKKHRNIYICVYHIDET